VFIIAWGGSLNRKGSDHIRKLKEVDNVIGFLEKFKEDLDEEEKEIILKTIDLLISKFTKKSES
jgi:hypothetical protein